MNNSNKLIITLLVANLAATIWFGMNSTEETTNQKPYEKASQHQLPELIDKSVKSEILNTFIQNFNSKNYEGLYDMFGPVAKSQISRKDMDVEFEKLTKFFHGVESGSFSFAELSGQQGSTTVYVLNYTVNLPEKSEFGQLGTLKITIAIESNEYQIYGIHLTGKT